MRESVKTFDTFLRRFRARFFGGGGCGGMVFCNLGKSSTLKRMDDSIPQKKPRHWKSGKLLTLDVKEAILEAFHNKGGVKYLERVADTDPRAFIALLSKLLPSKVEASGNAVVIALQELTDEQLEQRMLRTLASAARAGAIPDARAAAPLLEADVVSVRSRGLSARPETPEREPEAGQ